VRAESGEAEATPPPGRAADAPPSGAFDAAAASAAAATLAHGLHRGALDDAALARLQRLVCGHVPPAALEALGAALDDFDFSLALVRLDAVMAAIPQPVVQPEAQL
jgi:hypothetical protein